MTQGYDPALVRTLTEFFVGQASLTVRSEKRATIRERAVRLGGPIVARETRTMMQLMGYHYIGGTQNTMRPLPPPPEVSGGIARSNVKGLQSVGSFYNQWNPLARSTLHTKSKRKGPTPRNGFFLDSGSLQRTVNNRGGVYTELGRLRTVLKETEVAIAHRKRSVGQGETINLGKYKGIPVSKEFREQKTVLGKLGFQIWKTITPDELPGLGGSANSYSQSFALEQRIFGSEAAKKLKGVYEIQGKGGLRHGGSRHLFQPLVSWFLFYRIPNLLLKEMKSGRLLK